MSGGLTDRELIVLAREVATKVHDIVLTRIKSYDETQQRWATSALLRLNSPSFENRELAEATENCLVDILSCDNASWDTTPSAFEENLGKLEELISRASPTATT